ncbi:MAG: hypothetical protein H6809_07625 [Phycisphaeraceae bacterium]|nr:hypothetical protein [Phycisphaeraceae bacterium]
MRAPTFKLKPVWSNRFASPTVAELRSALGDEGGLVLDHAREALGGLPGVVEALKWMGVPWSWTLVYAPPGEVEGWAFVVPEPGKLQVAVSLPAERLAEIAVKRLPRFVRDGLLATQVVGRACWPVWVVQTAAQVDEIARLVQGVRVPAEAGATVS